MENIKVRLLLPDYESLLQYGEIESEHEFHANHHHTQVMKIRYMGILYHLKMINGQVESLKQWDSFAYQEDETDIRVMTDKEIIDMFMFSDRDREDNLDAERIYWLCIKEINRRLDEVE